MERDTELVSSSSCLSTLFRIFTLFSLCRPTLDPVLKHSFAASSEGTSSELLIISAKFLHGIIAIRHYLGQGSGRRATRYRCHELATQPAVPCPTGSRGLP